MFPTLPRKPHGAPLPPLSGINDALFISMGGIGNLVLLTPALQAFEKAAPRARLHFLLPKNNSRQVVECHPRSGEIIETAASIHSLPMLVARLRRIKPGLVVAASGTNPLKCGLIGLLCGARLRLGESFGAGRFLYNITIPFDETLHESTVNFRLIGALSPEVEPPAPTVWTNAKDRDAAQRFLSANRLNSRWAGLHLGSGPAMSYKRWPVERFIEVGRRLVERFACRIVIFGGPEEAEAAANAAQRIGNFAISSAGELTIRQSFEVMKHASLFVSNDSGPMHLAAAAGATVLAIFGPTLDYKTAPLGNRSVILTAPVACRPCYAYKPVTCRSLDCLKGIEVERVMEAAGRILGKP
ncbi:MAG: glycosyltransferase family 9 protein [Chitinispirillaceae bacterium]|nr:glycosyltransferase family 9 protein [Chitinispirillaceae bacterium]